MGLLDVLKQSLVKQQTSPIPRKKLFWKPATTFSNRRVTSFSTGNYDFPTAYVDLHNVPCVQCTAVQLYHSEMIPDPR